MVAVCGEGDLATLGVNGGVSGLFVDLEGSNCTGWGLIDCATGADLAMVLVLYTEEGVVLGGAVGEGGRLMLFAVGCCCCEKLTGLLGSMIFAFCFSSSSFMAACDFIIASMCGSEFDRLVEKCEDTWPSISNTPPALHDPISPRDLVVLING